MEKFKVGDKVKCIEKSDYIWVGEIGKIYTISDIVNENLDFEGFNKKGNSKSRFELVKEVIPPAVKKTAAEE